MNDQKVNGKYILAGIVVVIFTWVIHEFTHWFTSELLGYDTMMSLNKTSPLKGQNPTELHMAIISISAPMVTLLQGLVFFITLKVQGWNKYLYPFLFTALYMRFLAGLLNFMNLNDEGRVSQHLGIGTFTLSIIVTGLLFLMVYKISKKYSLSQKFQLITYLIVMLASSILILSDQFFELRIL